MLQLWRQDDLSTVCLCQAGPLPGSTMISGVSWRNLKEYTKELWAATTKWLGSLESHLKGGDYPWPPSVYMNSTQWDVTGLWKNTQWTVSVKTISAFYLFESLYTLLFSLSKGKGNLFDEEIFIPNWGGHWSYACAWMCLCNDEWMCLSAWECASNASGSSCNL